MPGRISKASLPTWCCWMWRGEASRTAMSGMGRVQECAARGSSGVTLLRGCGTSLAADGRMNLRRVRLVCAAAMAAVAALGCSGTPLPSNGGGGSGGAGGTAAGGRGGAGGAPACADVTTLADCDARSDCHAVFEDPHDCACAALGCCTRFARCAPFGRAHCKPGATLCNDPRPYCETPYQVSYVDTCYEGCVRGGTCEPDPGG